MPALHNILTADTLDVADLARIHEDSARAPDYLKTLIDEIERDDPRTQPRASWLLLHHATTPAPDSAHAPPPPIPQKHLETAIDILGNSPAWESRLHLCQLFSRVPCPPDLAEPLHEHLTRLAADKRAFLRAWALTALHHLAKTNPAFKKEAATTLRAARSDTSKAVQARLRKVLKA